MFVEHIVCMESWLCKLYVNDYNILRENDRLDSKRRNAPLFRYLIRKTFSIHWHLQLSVQRIMTKHDDKLLKMMVRDIQ